MFIHLSVCHQCVVHGESICVYPSSCLPPVSVWRVGSQFGVNFVNNLKFNCWSPVETFRVVCISSNSQSSVKCWRPVETFLVVCLSSSSQSSVKYWSPVETFLVVAYHPVVSLLSNVGVQLKRF